MKRFRPKALPHPYRLARWALRRPRTVLWTGLLLSLMAGLGMGRLRFQHDIDLFFGEENPQRIALASFRETFGNNENVLLCFAPRQGDVFTRDALDLLVELTDAAEQLPHVLQVYSLVRHRTIHTEGEDIRVDALIADPAQMSDGELDEARRTALGDPLLVHQLVSASGDTATLFVRVEPGAGDGNAASEIVRAARALRDSFRSRYPEAEFHLTGSLLLQEAFAEAGRRDMVTLLPPMFVVLFLIIGLALQSASGMLAALVIMVLSAVTAMGITGWLGIPLTVVSAGAPGLIVTLAVADCVHLVTTVFERMRDGARKSAALLHSMRVNARAVFLTSLTTAIGFLSLNASESPPFRDMGNIVALGVVTAFLFSIFLLPALLVLLPTRAGPGQRNGTRAAMRRLADAVMRRERLLRLVLPGMAVLAVLGLLRLELDADIHELYSRRMEIRRATDFHLDRLGAFTLLAYPFDSGEPGGVAEPEFLAVLDRFAQWYRTQPGVLHVSSVADILKRMHHGLHADNPVENGLPDSRAAAAQYLLLYDSSLPPGDRYDGEVDITQRTAAVHVRARRLTSRRVRALDASAQAWLRENAPPRLQTAGAGSPLLWAHLLHRNTRTMAASTLGALVLISLVMIPPLRNIRLGLLSLVPNLLPPLMAFGIWGFAVGRIGLPATVIAGMTIGIVVDDTIHFLSRYARARHTRGMDPAHALRHTFAHVGPAMATTTLALVAGFSVLSFSPFGMTAVMGRMCVLILALALALDLLLLPTLLLALERQRPITGNPDKPGGNAP